MTLAGINSAKILFHFVQNGSGEDLTPDLGLMRAAL